VAPVDVAALAEVNDNSVKGAMAVVDTGEEVKQRVLIQERVLMQLGKPESGRDAKEWIIDSGAKNHMTRSRMVFVVLVTCM
jgi:hypothetical protein